MIHCSIDVRMAYQIGAEVAVNCYYYNQWTDRPGAGQLGSAAQQQLWSIVTDIPYAIFGVYAHVANNLIFYSFLLQTRVTVVIHFALLSH